MTRFVMRRITGGLTVLLGVLFLVFALAHIAPGDPALLIMGLESADPERLADLTVKLGLDRPLWIQFTDYLQGLLRGDLGYSYRAQQPVSVLIFERLPATLELAGAALLLSLVIAVPLGTLAARFQRSGWDYVAGLGTVLGFSLPGFWLGLLLILTFALFFQWLPASGRGGSLMGGVVDLLLRGEFRALGLSLRHLILPAVTLAAPLTALLMRFVRNGVLQALGNDYIRTARAKGLSERCVLFRHALKNALIPMVTVLGLYAGRLLGGAVVIETVFAWPGAGRLMVNAIGRRDFPTLQGAVLVVAVAFIVIHLLLDLAYGWLDPRIRYE